MTLADFNRDWTPIIQLALSGLGLASLFLLWYQIKETSHWSRLNSHHNFLNNAFTRTLEKDLYDAAAKLGIELKGRRTPLTGEEVDKLLADNDACTNLVAYLNEFENIGGAVRAGIADAEVAYGIHSARVILKFAAYQPVIKKIRERDEDEEIWFEFEAIAVEWKTKAEKTLAEKRKRQEALRLSQGIQPKTGARSA